jgi:hypothetical protein
MKKFVLKFIPALICGVVFTSFGSNKAEPKGTYGAEREKSEQAQTPAPTPAPAQDQKTLTLNATGELRELLKTWNGKYVIFIHKDTDIKTLRDLNDKELYCDMYTHGYDCVGDMNGFMKAAGVKMSIGLGNNVPQFLNLMADNANKNMISFIPKEIAGNEAIRNSPNLKTVVFK